MKIDNQEKVGDIVTQDIRTAHVFKKYGIDFCCGGGISLDEACERKNVVMADVLADLENTLTKSDEEKIDFASWSGAELCDYIEEKHHTFVKESLPLLLAYAEKVASVHGHHHQEMIPLLDKVKLLADDLSQHLMKEEQVLFPWIRRIVAGEAESVPFGRFENPVSMMESDHDAAGELMAEINSLTKAYFLPDYACNTWRAYYSLLKDFEEDLHMHIHLENNILHSKARALDRV